MCIYASLILSCKKVINTDIVQFFPLKSVSCVWGTDALHISSEQLFLCFCFQIVTTSPSLSREYILVWVTKLAGKWWCFLIPVIINIFISTAENPVQGRLWTQSVLSSTLQQLQSLVRRRKSHSPAKCRYDISSPSRICPHCACWGESTNVYFGVAELSKSREYCAAENTDRMHNQSTPMLIYPCSPASNLLNSEW